MRQLAFKVNGEERAFLADGTVTVGSGTKATVKGRWTTQTPSNTTAANVIRYRINNQDQTPVPIRHSFNEFNQLVTVVPAEANGGSASAPCVWLGHIVVDDSNDIVYQLLTDENQSANHSITVYGKLRFAENTADLLIDMPEKATATIKGEKGVSGISEIIAEKNPIADFDARDQLRFVARTRNDFPVLSVRINSKAEIQFLGKWDITTNGLVFKSKVVGGKKNQSVTIGFAGKIEATALGFIYYADKSGKQVAFNIQGEHRWNSTEAAFKLSLGHSDNRFLAEFKGGLNHKGAGGNEFTLSGQFKLQLQQGKSLELNCKVDGKYEFKGGFLVFSVSGKTINGRQYSYDIGLEGKFVFRQGTLTFQAKLNKAGDDPAFHLAIGFKSNQDDLLEQIAIVLHISKSDVVLTAEFEIRMRFKDGRLVKDELKYLTPA